MTKPTFPLKRDLFRGVLSALVYRSRATEPMTDVDLFYLLAHIRDCNAKSGLTGLLLYDRGWFFQWLEGQPEALSETWNRIRRDPRHEAVTVFADQVIPVRLFDDWPLRFAHRDRQHDSVIDGFILAEAQLLEDLHLDARQAPRLLATFSRFAFP